MLCSLSLRVKRYAHCRCSDDDCSCAWFRMGGCRAETLCRATDGMVSSNAASFHGAMEIQVVGCDSRRRRAYSGADDEASEMGLAGKSCRANPSLFALTVGAY